MKRRGQDPKFYEAGLNLLKVGEGIFLGKEGSKDVIRDVRNYRYHAMKLGIGIMIRTIMKEKYLYRVS